MCQNSILPAAHDAQALASSSPILHLILLQVCLASVSKTDPPETADVGEVEDVEGLYREWIVAFAAGLCVPQHQVKVSLLHHSMVADQHCWEVEVQVVGSVRLAVASTLFSGKGSIVGQSVILDQYGSHIR